MYPIRRQILEAIRAARLPPLGPGEPHVTRMTAWPWDIDLFGDLNNGRVLTLMDVGRIGLAQRSGLAAAMIRRGWRIAMAGSAPQYRKRVTMFQPIEIRSRLVARDPRFFFIEQSMFVRNVATANVMCRTAVVKGGRYVPTDEVAAELGGGDWNPPVPDWVRAWAEADSARPWPPDPMIEAAPSP